MDIHLGSSSYLSRSLRKKETNSLNISSKNKNKFIYSNFSLKLIKDYKYNFIFIFLGKNFKNRKKQKSEKINYKLPLKLISKLIRSKKKIRVIFFGSFSEFDSVLGNNRDYIQNKIKLRKKLNDISRTNKNFEFVWIYLPNIYGKKQVKSFLIQRLIYNVKKRKKLKVNNGLKKIYLLNIDEFVIMIDQIKNNWIRYKNRSIFSPYEGPFVLKDIISKIIKNFKKKIAIDMSFNDVYEKKIKSNFKLSKKNSFSKFLRNVD